MAAIAPWEDPDLPAPFAQIEREIEGRARRFALWRWDERLAWRDLDYARLWWATFDAARDLDSWERAIGEQRWGRAWSQSQQCHGFGPMLGLPKRVKFEALNYRTFYKFHLIADSHGRGIGRRSDDDAWWRFPALDDARPLQPVQQGPKQQPLWWPGLQIPHSSSAVWSGYTPRLLSELPVGFVRVLRAGADAPILLIARDIMLWRHLHLFRPTFDFNYALPPNSMGSEINPQLGAHLLAHFELPPQTRLDALITTWPFNKKELGTFCELTQNGIRWLVQRWEDWPLQPPSSHQMLELQLRLRDALRPILTSAEIEEILAPAARL